MARRSHRPSILGPQHFRAQDAAIPSTDPGKPLTRDALMSELSVRGTLVYDRAQFYPYNPDDLTQVRPQGSYPGQGLWPKHGPFPIYRRMRLDEQVKACLTYKKLARLANGYIITPGSKTLLGQEIADFVKFNFDSLEGSWHASAKGILTALDFGFSCSEKIWDYQTSGRWKGKIVLRRIRTRAPETFRFNCDEFGNIKSLTQFLPTAKPIELPRNKFIVYTYAMEFENHYGQSDLRAAYRSYWSKDFVIKAWNIFLDRYGQPTRVMKLPAGSEGDTGMATRSREILDSIQTDTSITLPPGFELEFKTVGTGGNATYQEALDRYDRSIAKALLYPELGGLTERQPGGSQHMAASQMSGYSLVLLDLGLDLEDLIVNVQIVRDLVLMNYGPSAPVPEFKLGSMTLRDASKFVEDMGNAKKNGVITFGHGEESAIRKTLDLPEISSEDWKKANNTETNYTAAAAAGAGGPGAGAPSSPAGPQPPTEDPPPGSPMPPRPPPKKEKAALSFADEPGFKPRLIGPKEEWDHLPEKIRPSSRARLKTPHELQVDFSAIKRSLDTLEAVGVTWFAKLMARFGRDANAFVLSKKLLEKKGSVADILKLKFDPLPLERLLQNLMIAQYLVGKKHVVDSIRARCDKVPLTFGDLEDADEIFEGMLDDFDPDEEFDTDGLFNTFRKRGGLAIPMQRGEIMRVKDKMKVKAHAIASENRTKVLSNVQRMLQKAVDEGWGYDTWHENLQDSLGKYAGEVFGTENISEASHASVTFRTVLNETYNDGRLEAMQDENLGIEVLGVQFSAILDEATTKICEAADGKCMRLDNPRLVTPPFHFNCRSIIIEILEGEDDGVDWVSKLPVPPMKGFGKHDFADCHHFSTDEQGDVDYTIAWPTQPPLNTIASAIPSPDASVVRPDRPPLYEPFAIYTHRDDIDGLVSGIYAARLAWVLFGKVVPVMPISYDDLKWVRSDVPVWICDLNVGPDHPLSKSPYNAFFDHHQWDAPPAGFAWIEKDEARSATGVVAEALRRAISDRLGVMVVSRDMMPDPQLVSVVEDGDLWRENNPGFELARDLQYEMSELGFDAMFTRFASHPEDMIDAPEIGQMHRKRLSADATALAAAQKGIEKTAWGAVVSFRGGDRSSVMTALSKQLGTPIAFIGTQKGDSCVVNIKSAKAGPALALARKLGGGGHPNSGGASVKGTQADVLQILKGLSL